MNPNEEGDEVMFGAEGVTYINPRKSFNTQQGDEYVKKIVQSGEVIKMLEEDNAVKSFNHNAYAMLAQRGITRGNESLIPGYAYQYVDHFTSLALGFMKLDSKVEVIPQVTHIMETLGYCPVLILWHIDDANAHYEECGWDIKNEKDHPYQGRIKVVDFSQILF
jgi:hypothetical protein